MTIRILTGFNIIQDSKDSSLYYPVCIFTRMQDGRSYREIGLVADDLHNKEEALSSVRELSSVNIGRGFDTPPPNVQLQELRNRFPSTEEIGQTVFGEVVGWHIDYKSNTKKKSNPVLITNIAWLDYEGNLHYSVYNKKEVQVTSVINCQNVMKELMYDVINKVPLQHQLHFDVVPHGKLARYCMKDIVEVPTFMEEICQTLKSL